MHFSSYKRAQNCKNEARFSQGRHIDKDLSSSETILVGMRRDADAVELLSWAINVAGRPGDTIIALHLNHNGAKVENLIGKLQKEMPSDHGAAQAHLEALKGLCKLKKIQFNVRFALSGNEELEFLEGASSVLATMLVISRPSRSLLWNSQRKGSSLARKAPPGCSVVIVKDYKVLFYKESPCKDRSTYTYDSHLGTPIRRRKTIYQPFGSLQRQFSCTASPLWAREEVEGGSDTDTQIVAGSKIWPMYTGEGSPRGVLDSPGFLSESDLSSSSSTYGNWSHSLLPSGLMPRASPQQDGRELLRSKSQKSSSGWRNGSIRRTSTFPPSSRTKRFSGPLDYSSVRKSFKSYVNNIWSTESMSHDPPVSADVQQNWRCFFYEELTFATSDFNPVNLVGKGGHAEVYKGTLLDGRIVAIKRLKKGGSEEVKERDFLTELGIIGHVAHPNTTPLVGFCVEEGLHLIFDFSAHGSLATWLHGANTSLLDWPARYKVAVGIARGLHYLHTGCPRRIIHRDIKASNILLGPDFEPQISDFGLAKWLPEQWCQQSVFPVEGTFGYLAPEYFMHGIIHEKTDVFAFGVLLLELITGRQPIDISKQNLVVWAKPLLESAQIEKLVDPRLEGAYDPQEMQTMVLAAGLCVQSSDACRPYMGQVLELLTADERLEPISLSFSDFDFLEHSSEEYNTTTYRNDLSRHREIALQF